MNKLDDVRGKKLDVFLRGLLTALAGLGVVVAAPYAQGAPKEYSSFLPWIRAGVEEPSLVTLGALALVGFLSSFILGLTPFLTGTFAVVLLPVWATVEMVLDPKSHNLWPLEFGIYAFWGFVAFLGARVGARNRAPSGKASAD